MSQLHAELTEQANEMGYATIEDAERDGYHMVQDLIEGTFKLEKIDGQEQAHEAWLKERKEVLSELNKLYRFFEIYVERGIDGYSGLTYYVKHAIDFIKKGEI